MPAHKKGFTLLEMSIVVTIIAVLAGGGVAVFMVSLQRFQLQETYDKMQAIQQALYQYRVAFNRLPCPADIKQPLDGRNFGVEAENHSTCDGTPSATFHDNSNAESPHEGMIPVKTLKLPDDYAFDGWGRRIYYAVSGSMTQSNAFTVINANDITTRMEIKDGSGNVKTNLAGYVIYSAGANGHGGFTRFGGQTRINAASINADELENCDCTGNVLATGLNGTFVQRDPSIAFLASHNICDDVIIYGTRNDLRAVNE